MKKLLEVFVMFVAPLTGLIGTVVAGVLMIAWLVAWITGEQILMFKP